MHTNSLRSRCSPRGLHSRWLRFPPFFCGSSARAAARACLTVRLRARAGAVLNTVPACVFERVRDFLKMLDRCVVRSGFSRRHVPLPTPTENKFLVFSFIKKNYTCHTKSPEVVSLHIFPDINWDPDSAFVAFARPLPPAARHWRTCWSVMLWEELMRGSHLDALYPTLPTDRRWKNVSAAKKKSRFLLCWHKQQNRKLRLVWL